MLLPAFDVRAGQAPAPTAESVRLTKAALREMWHAGTAEAFAAGQYPAGHACDDTQTWLRSETPFPAAYRFGCEPYVLLSRRISPRYDEAFVGYGKDRVSFAYELAARGVRLRVHPSLFLVHYKTPRPGIAYAHAPRDWMLGETAFGYRFRAGALDPTPNLEPAALGETCWPAFHQRLRASYPHFEQASCAQVAVDRQVARALARRGESAARCVSLDAGACVGECRPEVAVFAPGRAELLYPARAPIAPPAPREAPAAASHLGEPTVFLVGCSGCGASALKTHLEVLPGLSFGRRMGEDEAEWQGEAPHYFAQEDKYTRGVRWYRAHYMGPPIGSAVNGSIAWVDASEYLAAPFAAARIRTQLATHASRQRFLVVLRDPTEAAWVLWQRLVTEPRQHSAYGTSASVLHAYAEGFNFSTRAAAEAAALERCLVAGQHSAAGMSLSTSPDLWRRCVSVGCGWDGCVVGAGLFAPQLHAWRISHADSRLAVFTLRELRDRPAAAAARVRRHLDLHLSAASAADASATASSPDCASELLQQQAKARVAEATALPEGAAGRLRAFYARLSAQLRRELTALGAPLESWRHTDAWLWADEEGSNWSTVEAAAAAVGGAGAEETEEAGAAAAAAAAGLPALFLLGCEKCGSTSLAFALSRHPQLRFARHSLATEPTYFRKELHFFDQDHRYTRGLAFYGAHFPNCTRRLGSSRPLLSKPPRHGVEVLLHDARTGDAVGWDAALNIPTTTPNSLLLQPAVNFSGVLPRYWLLDAASGRRLYLRDGEVLRAADDGVGGGIGGGSNTGQFLLHATPDRRFEIVDWVSRRRLVWHNDSMRAEPLAMGATGAWRLRRVSDSACPYWSPVARPARAEAAPAWARRVLRVALGWCIGSWCEGGELLGNISARLAGCARLTARVRRGVCVDVCRSPIGQAAGRVLPGCLCGGNRGATGRSLLASGAQPACGCQGGRSGTQLAMDATPMLHRAQAAWRMRAVMPNPRALRFLVILREPVQRAVSHFSMLRFLAHSRGEAWAALYVRNETCDSKLTSEMDALRRCVGGPGGGARLPRLGLAPKAWHGCTATACGFHACVVSWSLYAPQLKAWMNEFPRRQLAVLTLDEFAEAPRSALQRITGFLGLRSFPRMVLDWKWDWNRRSRATRVECAAETLDALRTFFRPHVRELAELLTRRRQLRAAAYVRKW